MCKTKKKNRCEELETTKRRRHEASHDNHPHTHRAEKSFNNNFTTITKIKPLSNKKKQ